MDILKSNNLEQKNIYIKGKTEFAFEGKSYKKKTAISKRFTEQIKEIAKNYRTEELEVIIVEHKTYFSIWIEDKPLNDSKENLNDFVNQKLKELGL